MAMHTEERLLAHKNLENLWAVCTHWYDRTQQELKDMDLAARVNAVSERIVELKSNNRRRDKAFFGMLGAIQETMNALLTEVQPRLQALEYQEMMKHQEGTLFKEDGEGQMELVVETVDMEGQPEEDKGTKFNAKDDAKMNNVPENNPTTPPSPTRSHGGARAGAGRKAIGVTQKISLSLPQEEWDYIDQLIADGHVASRAEYVRLLHMTSRYPDSYLVPVKGGTT